MTVKQNIMVSDIERALASQGNFCLIDWLIHESILAYQHYEAWRRGDERLLDQHLSVSSAELNSIIESTQAICHDLHLSPQTQTFYCWGENQEKALKASERDNTHEALTRQWLRPQDIPQMDIFMDNAAVIAENNTINALSMRNFSRAQRSLNQLIELNPNHEKLGRYQDLINYGEHVSTDVIAEADIVAELNALENEVKPLATEVLKNNTRDYLAFAWRRLSNNLGGREFTRDIPKLHNSYVLMQIPDWQATLRSLQEEKALFEEPELLFRLALCYEHLKREGEAIYTWCQLMELDANFAEGAIEGQQSKLIWHLWQDFWVLNEDDSTSFFPAFMIMSRPGIVKVDISHPKLKSAASEAVWQAATARIHKESDMVARKKMQAISPELLRIYLLAIK